MSFLIFSAVFAENSPYTVRRFPYCVGWLPYSVGRRNKEIRRQPYCIGAQEGGAVRSLPFVRGFVAFVGGESGNFVDVFSPRISTNKAKEHESVLGIGRVGPVGLVRGLSQRFW